MVSSVPSSSSESVCADPLLDFDVLNMLVQRSDSTSEETKQDEAMETDSTSNQKCLSLESVHADIAKVQYN